MTIIWLNITIPLISLNKGADGQMNKVSASQPWDPGFEPLTGHNHDSPYGNSTGWYQEPEE